MLRSTSVVITTIAASALMLRLRAGFGVSAKSDVLSFLLGIEERPATIQSIASATGYAGVTVRDATRDMALARLIRSTGEHPVSYYTRRKPWASGGEHESALPAWQYWTTIFAFLTQVDEFARSRAAVGGNAYVQSSLARDHYEVHRSAFTNNRIDVPNPDDYRGTAYLTGFRDTVQALSEWMAQHL